VTSSGWPEAIANLAAINELRKQRGWQQATVWTQTFGPFNELSIEFEYDDLASYERENAAFSADDEARRLRMEGRKHLRADGSGYSDIWERIEP
jgi:hypothetical protein